LEQSWKNSFRDGKRGAESVGRHAYVSEKE
jgi:hypothetical protein